MTTSAIRLGLIGAGRWGRNVIRTVNEIQDLDLVVVASRNPETRSLIAETTELVEDYEAVLEFHALDGVVIATPPQTHAVYAAAAIEHGVAVFIEKPLTPSSASADALVAAAAERNLIALVDHIHLFSDAFSALIEHLPAIGNVREIRASAGNKGPVRDDADVLWDWGPHDIAMVLRVMADDPVDVDCSGRPLPNGAEDVSISLKFSGDVSAALTFNNGLDDRLRVFTVVGDQGALSYVDAGAERYCLESTDPALAPEKRVHTETASPLATALRAFSTAIRTGTPLTSDLGFGARVVAVLERAEAAKTRAAPQA